MIKAVFFDIDGTLIDHNEGVIPGSTIRCLHALRKKGIKLFVATGRVPGMVGFLEEVFPFDGFVTLNGQLVRERDGAVLHRMAHEKDDIRQLLALLRETNFPCLLIEEEESFQAEASPTITEHFQWLELPIPAVYDPERLEQNDILQFLAYMPPEESTVLSSLPHIEVTSAGGEILDIIPKGGGKEIGIAAAAAHYGLSREEVMVFGDGDNDARMLRWAGVGVAMGNGSDQAKAAADYITDDVGRDGVLKALLHLGVLLPADLESIECSSWRLYTPQEERDG